MVVYARFNRAVSIAELSDTSVARSASAVASA